jgi:hypothetical protein
MLYMTRIKLMVSCPQAKYNDRATAAVDEVSANFCGYGVAWSAQRIFTAVNLGFINRSRYFSFQVFPQLSSRG